MLGLIPRISLLCVASAALLAGGCTLGPRQINRGRLQYNEAIQQTLQEEMLLNIVRLKYREVPEFVSINGVAAQYAFESSAGLRGTLLEGGPDILGLDAGVSRAEKPTISYAPLRSREFHEGFLAPIDLETVLLVGRTGWSWDRIFRMTVQSMNGIDNATSAGGPTPELKPDFEQFRYLSRLFRQLQMQRGGEMAYANRAVSKTLPVKTRDVDSELIVGVLNNGYRFRTGDPTDKVVLEKDEDYEVLVFHPAALNSYEAREIVRLLNLDPGHRSYELLSARKGQIQPAFGESNEVIEILPNPHGQGPVDIQRLPSLNLRKDVTVGTRSLLEVLYYLSQGVSIPWEHYQRGLVTVTVDEFGEPFDWSEMNGDLFNVYVSECRPDNAAVAVKFKGYWYYIDDSDLDTQSTFTLLVELFGIEVRGGGGGSGIFYSLNVGG